MGGIVRVKVSKRFVFIVVLIVLASAAVWAMAWTSAPDIDSPTAERLASIADDWCQNAPERSIPEVEWPTEVRQLNPLTVRVKTEGVYIELETRFVESRGIFILRSGSEFRPLAKGDPSYRLLNGRVFWYEIKG
jgi:hypothetical protein